MLQLTVQKVDRQWELGRCEHLVTALLQKVLEREILTEPLPENPEQISLLDVFFAGEHFGHRIRISLGIPSQEGKPQRLKVSTTRPNPRNVQSMPTVRYPNNQESRPMVPGAKGTFC
jgi:hypothetical protein